MRYLINTVGIYTYDDPSQTPCPYKLLIGSEKGSSLKDVVSDDSHREIFFSRNLLTDFKLVILTFFYRSNFIFSLIINCT